MDVCDITDKTNICEMYNCIDNVVNTQSGSSFSDGWILNLKNSTHSDKKLDSVFIKFFISPESMYEKFKDPKIADDLRRINFILVKLENLNYELNLYKNIINPIIKLNMCSNFVNYISLYW